DPQGWASAFAGLAAIWFAAMAMGLGASHASSLWRALTHKPQRRQEQPVVGLPSLPSRPASSAGLMVGLVRLARKKPPEVTEPLVYTEEDGLEEGDRGFFSAVEKAEGADGKTRPLVPRVLESRPIPDAAPAPVPAPSVAARTVNKPQPP